MDNNIYLKDIPNHDSNRDLEVEFYRDKDSKLNIEIVDVNPTAGSHCGPDCIGVSFHAVRR